jgi:hypothetical protein
MIVIFKIVNGKKWCQICVTDKSKIINDDTGLVQWIQILSQSLQAQQELINQLQSDYNAIPDGIFSGDILIWNGTAWIPETFFDECGAPNGNNSTCFTGCGDGIMHEGFDYETVQIGDQCWFSENCRYLPEVSPSNEGSETEPYYYVYDYQGTDVAAAKATSNYETYGVLYNWPAVMTEGICPSGWHIPSDGEFTEL